MSKIARIVDLYAKRPQVQERLTTQVADALMEILEARGVIVVIEAEHLCMTMRGVRKAGARTITSAVREQPAPVVDGRRRVGVAPPVGEGVGRDVHDPHQLWGHEEVTTSHG